MNLTDTTRDLSISNLRQGGSLARYARRYRPAIQALAQTSPRLEELSETFPALLFALATGYAAAGLRQEAVRLIHQGAPLRDAADRIGLPWWLRRLPPEGFEQPLAHLPDSAPFALRIINLVPADAMEAAAWLGRTSFACRAVGEDYALWIARQRRFPAGVIGEISESLLAAWAWHCRQPETPAHAVVRTLWSEGISLRRALEEAKAWSLRVDLAVALGAGIEDTWFAAGLSGSYAFVPLVRLEDFLSEAEAMNNCLDQFADQVRQGRSRVFSIRKGGRIVADVEIGAHDDDCAVPHIVQLRGPRNRRAGPEIWQATLAWLAQQPFRPLPRVNAAHDRVRRQQLIRAIWRPMMESVKGSAIEDRIQAVAFGKEISRSYRAFQGGPAPEAGRDERRSSPVAAHDSSRAHDGFD